MSQPFENFLPISAKISWSSSSRSLGQKKIGDDENDDDDDEKNNYGDDDDSNDDDDDKIAKVKGDGVAVFAKTLRDVFLWNEPVLGPLIWTNRKDGDDTVFDDGDGDDDEDDDENNNYGDDDK